MNEFFSNMRKKRLKPEKWHSHQEKCNLSIYTHLKLCRMKSMLSVIHPYKTCLPLVRSEEGPFPFRNSLLICFIVKHVLLWNMTNVQDTTEAAEASVAWASIFFLFCLEKRMNEMVTDDTFIYVNMPLRIILWGEASECCVASASFTR